MRGSPVLLSLPVERVEEPCAWQPRPTFIASGARGGAPVRGSPVNLHCNIPPKTEVYALIILKFFIFIIFFLYICNCENKDSFCIIVFII